MKKKTSRGNQNKDNHQHPTGTNIKTTETFTSSYNKYVLDTEDSV